MLSSSAELAPKKELKPKDEKRAIALYERIMQGHITINFALDKLFKYGAPRILNAFEIEVLVGNTNNIKGNLREQRLQAEKHHFGIPIEVSPRSRPRYAALNYKNHPSGAAARNDYGLSYMVLSDSIRPACTITIGDSFDVIGTEVDGAFPFTSTGVRKLAEAVIQSYSAADFDNTNSFTSGDSYLDVQIHADVDIRKHVEEIFVSTLEMRVFGLDIGTVDKLIGNLTGGVFVREE